MSRPPRPYPSTEVSAGLPIANGRLQVFAPTYKDLLDVETNLSLTELGQLSPGGNGDFATTLFGLSAVVAHVLGVYQDFYGGEAFLSTARTEQSLVRHGRRIGYTTDPGVAATGVIAVDVKPGLSGDLSAGLPLLSVPKGLQGTETYETLEARHVDAAWNSIELAEKRSLLPQISLGDLTPNSITELSFVGVGLGLLPGDVVVLTPNEKATDNEAFRPVIFTVVASSENDAKTATIVTLQVASGVSETDRATTVPRDHLRLLAKPNLDLRLFGWNADPSIFPPDALQSSAAFNIGLTRDPDVAEPTEPGSITKSSEVPNFGYKVYAPALVVDPQEISLPGDVPDNIYLEQTIRPDIAGQWVVRLPASDAKPIAFYVANQNVVSVTFTRDVVQITKVLVPGATAAMTTRVDVPQWIAATVTALRLSAGPRDTNHLQRRDNDMRSRWLAGWQLALALVTDEPNKAEVAKASNLTLAGDFTGLEPGMLVILASQATRAAQLVELKGVTTAMTASGSLATTISWVERGPRPAVALTLGDTSVLGNIIRVSHGKTVQEVLGDSDGGTPFQQFALKKFPLTYLPEAAGATPALQIRVNDVLWSQVGDFANSGPEDRHYIVQRDESQVTHIVFGDGRNGAIPGSGQRNIQAVYRVGLGRLGNVDAGRLSRLQKAHPLIQIVRNPLPISGGTQPAALEQIRFESTRYVRTFDRAVSASDYADLAVLFPGVARSQSASTPNSGVTLVVADADGHALNDNTAFLNFINSRRDGNVPLELKNPVEVMLFAHVKIEFEPAFFDWQIERAVRAALSGISDTEPGLFTFRGRQLGEAAFLSRVYQVIQGVPGVVFSQILHFDLKPKGEANAAIVRDSIRVATHEWLSLLPTNLIIDTARRE